MTNETLYQVTHNGRIVASGNFRQCVMYLMNVADSDRPVAELQMSWKIEPAKKAGE